MRILDLAFKDLIQIFRDRKSLLFLAAMPVVFTLFMGIAYRGQSEPAKQDSRLPIAWVDRAPEAPLNQALFARLEASTSVHPIVMDETEARQALQSAKVDGVLLVPAGFSQGAAGSGALTLIADSASATGQSLYQVLRVPVTQLMSAVEISQISTEVIDRQEPLSEQQKQAEAEAAFQSAWASWEASQSLSQVRLEKAVSAAADPFGGSPYNQSSPGMLVMFAIFGLVTSAQVLVQERKTRTLQRLMTTAMRPWEIIAGHMGAMFAIVILQTILLVVFGQLALKVNYLREPIGTLIVSVALGVWISSLGLLIGVLAKGDDQVVLFSMICMFLFSALGGVWFPLEGAGSAFVSIGRLMPSAWAMAGYQNILIRGLGLASAWLPAGVLAAYALAFFSAAVWRLRKAEI